MRTPFKVCTACSKSWATRDAFLEDPEIKLVGYQGAILGPDQGFFYLNHTRPTCLTTLAVSVGEFADLYDGSLVEKHRSGRQPCPAHCFFSDDIIERPDGCECLYVRKVMKRLQTWPKVG